MKTFQCSYAYDVPHYVDFVVEANTPEEAQAIIQKALDDGGFSSVAGEPDYNSCADDRVFVVGEEREPFCLQTMEELIGEANREK